MYSSIQSIEKFCTNSMHSQVKILFALQFVFVPILCQVQILASSKLLFVAQSEPKSQKDGSLQIIASSEFGDNSSRNGNEVHGNSPTLWKNSAMGGVRSTRKRQRVKRAATALKERLWDFGVIPYEIDEHFTGFHKTLFKQAMRHWESQTCVKFVERTEEHPNYVVFTEKSCGCCSSVGRQGIGPQAISISIRKHCDQFGIVVHELGHAVGFWHEHTRPDRDEHVTIFSENIKSPDRHNFNRANLDEVDSLGEPYDFGSIMHYQRNSFSRDSAYLDTMLPRIDPVTGRRPDIGQRTRLSRGDVIQANKLYTCSACGRTMLEPKGFLASLYHPSATNSSTVYNHGEMCEWRIVATHGEKIVLNITDFDIPYSNGCTSDFLEIRDGYWHKNSLLGRFCGSNPSLRLISSSGSRMLLTYRTSKSPNSYKGFTANYEAVCGGDLIAESGNLESPNFPGHYMPSKDCVWRISVPVGFQVGLIFHSFEIENHENCVYDFLEIRDGLNQNSKLIGKYCDKSPGTITSTSNHLWIRFVSDDGEQRAGFSASFLKERDECELGLDNCAHICQNTIGSFNCGCKFGFELHSNGMECVDACGGIIEETNGTLVSPSFPNLYPKNTTCVWEIMAPEHNAIALNFTHFDLEGSFEECDFDTVEIFSKLGPDGNGEYELKKHGRFCGSNPPPMITSEENSIRLVFKSDNSIQKTGFALSFFPHLDPCAHNGGCAHLCRKNGNFSECACRNGYILHANGHDCEEVRCKFNITTPPIADIQSPNYPEFYPANEECVWHISTVLGHRVQIEFKDFEMESQQNCYNDMLIIYDGPTSESTTLGKFCGNEKPAPLLGSSNELMALFKSDGSVQQKGFILRHSTVCGGNQIANDEYDVIYSHPGYGKENYEEMQDCEWTIETDEEVPIELIFLTFEIEEETNCKFDFVKVYTGNDDLSSNLVGKYCGNLIPPPLLCDEGSIILKFVTDGTMSTKGFSAKYRLVDSPDETSFDEEQEDNR